MGSREKLLRLILKVGFTVSAVAPGKVFQNHILLLERNLVLISSLTMLMFPLSASICQEIRVSKLRVDGFFLHCLHHLPEN